MVVDNAIRNGCLYEYDSDAPFCIDVTKYVPGGYGSYQGIYVGSRYSLDDAYAAVRDNAGDGYHWRVYTKDVGPVSTGIGQHMIYQYDTVDPTRKPATFYPDGGVHV